MNVYRMLKGLDEAVKNYPALKARLKSIEKKCFGLAELKVRLKSIEKECTSFAELKAGLKSIEKECASHAPQIEPRESPAGASPTFNPHQLREMFTTLPSHLVLEGIKEHTKSQYLGGNRAVSHLSGHDFIFLDTRDTGIVPHLMFNGFWEPWTMSFFARVITPGCVLADVGANFGYFSVLSGALAAGKITLLPVEANPRLVDLIRRTLSINGFPDAEIIERAAWHCSGETLEFGEPEGEMKNGALLQFRPDGEKSVKFNVQTITLDDALCGKGVDVLKIDVEGAEVEVWDGMQRLLSERPELISLIEVNYGRRKDCTRIVAEARQLGLNVGHLDLSTCDGWVRPLDVAALTGTNIGQDWLLVITRRPLDSLNSPL